MIRLYYVIIHFKKQKKKVWLKLDMTMFYFLSVILLCMHAHVVYSSAYFEQRITVYI